MAGGGGDMCRPFGGGMIPLGGQCYAGFGTPSLIPSIKSPSPLGGMSMGMGMGSSGGCVPNAVCMGGICQCQTGYIPVPCIPLPLERRHWEG